VFDTGARPPHRVVAEIVPPQSGRAPSADFLRQQGQAIRLATYDDRMRRAAAALEMDLYPL